jgi:hypothetical protein
MYVIPQYKFCYIAAPRTGSKACARALVEHRGAVLVGSHHTSPDDHDYDIGKDWTVCSTVRNHWDTMISWYFKIERKAKAMTPLHKFLPRFCENNPNFVRVNQLWWIGATHVNTGLRYECLQADFDQALVKAGMAPLDLPTIIDSARDGAPYQAFYKRASVAWVADYFKEEIQRCGYKF